MPNSFHLFPLQLAVEFFDGSDHCLYLRVMTADCLYAFFTIGSDNLEIFPGVLDVAVLLVFLEKAVIVYRRSKIFEAVGGKSGPLDDGALLDELFRSLSARFGGAVPAKRDGIIASASGGICYLTTARQCYFADALSYSRDLQRAR